MKIFVLFLKVQIVQLKLQNNHWITFRLGRVLVKLCCDDILEIIDFFNSIIRSLVYAWSVLEFVVENQLVNLTHFLSVTTLQNTVSFTYFLVGFYKTFLDSVPLLSGLVVFGLRTGLPWTICSSGLANFVGLKITNLTTV